MRKHVHLVCWRLNENERSISETRNEENILTISTEKEQKILEEEEDVMLEETILKEVSTKEEEGNRISNIKNNY